VQLSGIGRKMAHLSGLRGIMEDIATSMDASADRQWLNLGIGNPAAIPEVTATWQRMTAEALADSFHDTSCRYGPSRGLPRLVDAIVAYFNERYGWDIGPRNVVVGPGSQMLAFIAAALFTGADGDRDTKLVLPMTPDYTGYQGLSMTPGGIVGIEPVVATGGHDDRSFRYLFDLPALERQKDVGLLLVSTPGNPTGRCASPAEIHSLVAAAEAHDVPLMVDNAYGAPFPGIAKPAAPPVRHERIVNCFSLSKAGLPGERLGFAIGEERHIDPIVSFLANCTLHAPQLVQSALARALETGALDTMVEKAISPFYARRRTFVESLLVESLPAGISWRMYAAEGGMFCWIWVDEDWFDDLRMYRVLKERGVFIVPGRHFFTDPEHSTGLGRHPRQCFRVSITADEATLAAGIEVIGQVLTDMHAGTSRVPANT
jgi:valine--pyruvate aminotransferase